MTTVTGYTAARMKEIEDASVIDGDVVGDNLILTKHNGQTINAGNVRGPAGTNGTNGTNGAQGPQGPQGPAGVSPVGIGCRISNSYLMSIPHGVYTQITNLDVEFFDDGGLHSSSNPGRVVVPVVGIYTVAARVQWATNFVGVRATLLSRYNSFSSLSEVYTETVSANVSHQCGMCVINKSNVGDFFVVDVYQDSGGPLNILVEGCQLMTAKVG